MENILRDLTDDESVHLSEYVPEPESDASEKEDEFVGESEQESYQPPPGNRPARRRRNRAKRRHGRSLGLQWMAARNPQERPSKHLLSQLRLEENECPFCEAYQYPEECGAPGSKHRYWHCCSNGRVHDMIMAPESDPDGLEALEDGEAKDAMRAFEAEVQTSLHELMYEVEASGDVMTRTKASRDFQELIISYNNVLSFCSELAAIDYKNSGWATFRSMGGVKHMLGSLMAPEGELAKFCQIHQIDASQEALERRMDDDVGGSGLHRETLLQLQRLLKKINPYVDSLKTCGDRFLENPNPDTRVHLKQHDPSRQNKGTHNKPTSSEVAAIMILPDDMSGDRVIERDILVQSIHGGMISIPFWQSCYMPLRYPLIYPYGEQSWNKLIPLRGHDASKGLLARRPGPGEVERHGMDFREEDGGEPEDVEPPHPDAEAEEAEENSGGGDVDEDGGVACGRGGSTRVTQKEFYRYQLQVSYLAYCLPSHMSPNLHAVPF